MDVFKSNCLTDSTMVGVSSTSFNIVGRSMLDVFYGVGSSLSSPVHRRFLFDSARLFSPFPTSTPSPVRLNTINSPAVFISICELDDLQRENRWSVYRLGLRELNLYTGMRWTMSQHGLNKGFFSFPFSKNNKLRT